jgi:hypothetical protein
MQTSPRTLRTCAKAVLADKRIAQTPLQRRLSRKKAMLLKAGNTSKTLDLFGPFFLHSSN